MQTIKSTSQSAYSQSSNFASFSWMQAISVCLMIILGSFTYSIYPVPVNLLAFVLLIGLFYFYVDRSDFVSLFIMLFIGNFFTFGVKYGGNYNITASLAILIYVIAKGNLRGLAKTSLNNTQLFIILLWWLIQILSVIAGNDFSFHMQLNAISAFSIIMYLHYFSTTIILTEQNTLKIINASTLFFIYLFLVALNQKYRFIDYDIPFFPLNEDSLDYDLGIVRSTSTLGNFEAYAEYCVSFIALLIPSVLSGTLYEKNKHFYWLVIIAMMIGVLGLVLTATRSSMLLLPLIFITSIIMLGRRVRLNILFKIGMGMIILFAVNTFFQVVDFSVFMERSSNINFRNLTLDKVLSGEELNRGGAFKYAWNQIYQSNGVIGRGYFSTSDEYRYTHFPDNNIGDGVADYHNVFFSSYVLWGGTGLLCLLFSFLSAINSGTKIYWKLRRSNSFLVDLILGFTIMFFFFLINQLKIQFIRDINYFMVILLMLGLYSNILRLTKNITDKSQTKGCIK